jgi:hypothetical protein
VRVVSWKYLNKGAERPRRRFIQVDRVRPSVDYYEAEPRHQRELGCTHNTQPTLAQRHQNPIVQAGDCRHCSQVLLSSEVWNIPPLISAMALSAARLVVAGRSSALLGCDSHRAAPPPATQCVSVPASRIAPAPLQRPFSGAVAPAARRPLHAIATNSRGGFLSIFLFRNFFWVFLFF